jgi:hypothetical protein
MATIGPELDGAPTLFSVEFDLASVGYSVHEHLVTGEADAYAIAGARTPDGRWDVVPAARAPFTTRLIVYRPIDPAACNGTVIVEWLNVTGGLDIPAIWMPTHRHLVRRGVTWVGVTSQQVGVVGGGVMPGLGLLDTAPERYATLRHPGDAYAYGLFSEVGRALRHGLPEHHGVPVERLLAVGASQSAMYLTTYVNALHERDRVFDGFLLQGRAGAAPPIEAWDPVTISLRDEDADASRDRLEGRDWIRDDGTAPVVVVQSETDVLGRLAYLPARQPDNDRLRLWEVAGAAHCDTYFLCAAPHDSGRLPIEELAALIARADSSGMPTPLPINSGPQMHYVLQRAVDALEQWIRDGREPPGAPLLAVDDSGRLLVDEWGVARGGIRTPWVDAPVAVLSGLGQPGVLAALMGVTRPFDPGTLGRRYRHGRHEFDDRFAGATRDALAAGWLLADDAAEIGALGRLGWPSDRAREAERPDHG